MAALCCVGILLSGCSKSHTSNSAQKTDSVALQGTWSGQELGGEPQGLPAIPQGIPSFIFDGAKCELHAANPQEYYKATFTLLEDTTPKRFEAVITDCPEKKYIGKTSHGIYKIEDGTLTFTANEPGNPAVPTNFDAPDARRFVFKQK